MIIYPAIDLKNARVVRLTQGRADAETVYSDDPGGTAREWKDLGAQWLHTVDLDGAFTGENTNFGVIRSLVESGLKVQLGGGMRTLEKIGTALELGVQRIVIGTRAAENPEFVQSAVEKFGAEHIAVGIDARDGKVAIKGWVDTVDLLATDLAQKVYEAGARYVIYTDIARDGMLSGPNFDALQRMLECFEGNVIASGGVHQIGDIVNLRKVSAQYSNLDGVITGRALYEKTLDLAEALEVAEKKES